jgi:hypothetical protein
LIEAWEEAGLVGTMHASPIGAYEYEKAGRSHHVTVYILNVTDEKAEWPERSERTRVWVSLAEAARRVEEPGLRDILRKFLPEVDPIDDSDDPFAAVAAELPAD